MESKLISKITQLVFLSRPPYQSGLLIVLGTFRPGIIKRALKVYQQGLAYAIITTGSPIKNGLCEARYQKQYLVKNGVPSNLVFTENKSSNTKENAINAYLLAQEKSLDVSSIILVTKTYHAARAYMTFKKVFNHSVINLVPATDDTGITASNWFTSNEKRKRVMAEVKKIGKYYLQGDLDF